MAGHSKWSNIQHRKNAQDKKRGAIFTKLVREITVAARMGGADIEGNPRLRLAVDKALAVSMPKDNIERAIRRGAGETGADQVEEVRYEGYAPGGIAVMVDCMTDNRTRTVADVETVIAVVAVEIAKVVTRVVAPAEGKRSGKRRPDRVPGDVEIERLGAGGGGKQQRCHGEGFSQHGALPERRMDGGYLPRFLLTAWMASPSTDSTASCKVSDSVGWLCMVSATSSVVAPYSSASTASASSSET